MENNKFLRLDRKREKKKEIQSNQKEIINNNMALVSPSVQFSHSVVSDSATPWIAARQASLSITNSQSLLKLMSLESVMENKKILSASLRVKKKKNPNVYWWMTG